MHLQSLGGEKKTTGFQMEFQKIKVRGAGGGEEAWSGGPRKTK